MKFCIAIACLTFASCATPSGVPLLVREPALDPIEGVEDGKLVERAHGAVLVARGDRPIEVLALPSLEWKTHPVRGDVLAIAGPDPAGTFLYALAANETKRGRAFLRRASLVGADDALVATFDEPVAALASSRDGSRAAAVLVQAGPSVAHDLVLVDVASGAVTTTDARPAPTAPVLLDDGRVAYVEANGDVALLDPSSGASTPLGAHVGAIRAWPDGHALLVASKDPHGLVQLARVPLDGGTPEAYVVHGVLAPLALLDEHLLVAIAAPTLGAEPQWELDVAGPWRALATIKLYDLDTGKFTTIVSRASPAKAWSAGSLGAPSP